jgi:hypothetical protein
MTIFKSRGQNPLIRIGFLSLIGILVLFCAGCESIFGPKSEETSSTDDSEIARIIVYNNYNNGSLDIYMDGVFQFTLAEDDNAKIKDVTLDEHALVAKVTGTSTVVDDTTIDVTAYSDYTWTIDDPPDIKVTNSFGTPLKIYMDGEYKFDLENEEDRWLIDVSFGDHYLKALKASDNREVASTTIAVNGNEDYTWTIS